ncbi:hypothetical protein CJ030_MR1G023821 [Morella rubra]|uniref:Uncharacterized protein n=1 Tax=Morella rubra TaxID=262757 RepID=A0A6A1WS30_9ROSI|nr:hypothetical protein CJ030_MR1G023821 [Morella rubra]
MAYNIDPRKCTTESTFERVRLMVRLVRGVPMDLPGYMFKLALDAISRMERGEVKRKRGEVERDEIRRFVALDAWKSIGSLCEPILTSKHEGKSEINRRNKSKLTVYHTTGTKSFARKRHELLGAVQIDEVGPADLYAASHKRKNGEWICDAARMNFEKMMEVEAQATMEGRTLTDVEYLLLIVIGGYGAEIDRDPVGVELEQIRADREKESQEQMHEIHSLQQKMEEMQERMARYDRFMSRFASGAFDDVGV